MAATLAAANKVSDLAYGRLKLLALAIEEAFKNRNFSEANALLSQRQVVLDEIGPSAELSEAQAAELGAIETRLGWQVHQARGFFEVEFRRLRRAKSAIAAYQSDRPGRLIQAS